VKIVSLTDAERRPRRLAVGTFDGVHLGHRQVIAGSDSVLTFDPHPVSVVAPEHTPRLLTTSATKAELVAAMGVSEMIVIPFSTSFAARSAQSFIDDVLVGALGAERVSVGENFRFGHRAQGTPELLRADGRFQTVVHPMLEVDGEIVSSSHIRGLLAAGDVDRAQVFLGAPFEVRGEVVHGDARGRQLGYPTANLIPDETLVTPGHGVYACTASVVQTASGRDGLTPAPSDAPAPSAEPAPPAAGAHGLLADAVPAAVSVGVRPTFATGRGELIEAYLIDFDGDIYGRELRLWFLHRLRGERRFDSSEALVQQMALDVAQTRRIVDAHAGRSASLS
jgi:riboflavin kinase/FMN adenylyltransferase